MLDSWCFWCPSSYHQQILFPLSNQYVTNKSISRQFLARTSLCKHNPTWREPFLHSASEERGGRELEVLNQQLGLDRGIIEVGEEQAGPNKHLQQEMRAANKA